jgi:myo-inositol-1(or 4)-monophosphatase
MCLLGDDGKGIFVWEKDRMENFLKIAEKAAREAGDFLTERFSKRLFIEKKGKVNLVTDADRKAEDLIKKIILSEFPDHCFKAEEGSESSGNTPYLWLVDPLDGTTNFAHGFPVWCVSIALLEGKMPLIGCIYNPNLGECFTVEKGKGAFLNRDPIEVSLTENLDDSLLATGFPYDIRDSADNNLREFSAFALSAQAVRRAGSAALDLAYLACGRFDGFWEFKLSPWDIAAGILLVNEAKGKIGSWSGGECDIFKGEVLASNGKIHNQMLEILKNVRSDCG